MEMTVSYSSRRTEVWNLYWGMWRRKLWKTHAAAFTAVALTVSYFRYGGIPTTGGGLCFIIVAGLAPLIFLVSFPMIQFKSEKRQLAINASGIQTSIGKYNKLIPWNEVAKIRDEGGAIVIQGRNLNSFIVPSRAFHGEDQRKQFRDFASAMLNADVSKS